jgi:class 3 adenylate cyclase/tetratricopeptide (TPR) repeat protein
MTEANPPLSEAPGTPQCQQPGPGADRVALYVPRILQQHLAAGNGQRWWVREGTAVFVDISGFTALSEQLARKGREGAEQITETIGGSFEHILKVAYDKGGSLLKFGGDALLLWFEGDAHVERACDAAVTMRSLLDDVGRIRLPDAEVTLQMSQGVHSGEFHFFAVGTSHTELLPTGPGWSRLVAMEQTADAGEILVSVETAARLSAGCGGESKGPGVLLSAGPGGTPALPLMPRPQIPSDRTAHCLPPAVRGHVLAGGIASEHRPVTVAFLRFEGVDELIAGKGADAAADALHRLVSVVEAATEGQDVALLASDVDANGGKLILTAGAPKVTGDDEERMLLAVRHILDAELPLPVRIGVNRGAVFAGDIGPAYRRTFTVMGDPVNLAARVMARSEAGHAYVTEAVLERSNTLFETTEIEPFAVKGKAEPVQAWSLGRAKGSRSRSATLQKLALTGRNNELGVIRKVLGGLRTGVGHLIEVNGQPGVGKTRLLEAARDAAIGFRKLHNTCEAYTASTPYAVWRDLLRELLEIPREAPEAEVESRLRATIADKVPDVAPWLPLIATAFGISVDPTPEVAMLADENRRGKLHETVGRFLEVLLPGPAFIEIENAHHMDEASADLLVSLVRTLGTWRWLVGVARRPGPAGFSAPEVANVTRVELKPLAAADALRMAQLATQANPLPAHVLEVVAQRSGGNPQFLRDLLRFAIQSGGVVGLPESAEAAALARIDALPPEDRAVVRRAAMFGLTFHPRMLAWFDTEDDPPPPSEGTFARLSDLFDEDGDGYFRFRQSLLRDTAYEGLPFKLRRRLHAAVAARVEQEADNADEVAGILSLHYAAAGEHALAWRHSMLAAARAEGAYAFVEAAGLYARALEAGCKLPELNSRERCHAQERLADAWFHAGEYRKALDAYSRTRELAGSDPLPVAGLLLKLSLVEEKLGQYPEALRWAERARDALAGTPGRDAALLDARISAWYANVLQAQGNTAEALKWAEQAVRAGEQLEEPSITGNAYMVMGWGYSVLGKEGGEALMLKALDAHTRSGNRVRQASTLSNLGSACYWDGRWDDAMSYFERGRDELIKVGSIVKAAVASLGIAEILSDRGELAEAEATLQQTMPVWKASEYHYFLGYCVWMLGRVALRGNRIDDALARFAEARTLLAEVGAEHEVLDIDARVAECRLFTAEPDAALAAADGILAREDASGAVARLAPLLHRVRGYALVLLADPFGAREAFEASLAIARERNERFEVALTLNALIELDRLEGVEPPQEFVDESKAAIARLKIRALPAVPAIA